MFLPMLTNVALNFLGRENVINGKGDWQSKVAGELIVNGVKVIGR